MIALIPMIESEYQVYIEQSLQEYAREHVRAGRWNEEEALHQAKQELQEILPQGLHSPDQYLSMIVDEQLGKPVGVLWFALRPRAGQQQAFVYDVVIFEEFRRHGYARRAFELLEERARELGATSIGLHVFGHNGAARQIYEKLGFVATNILLVKKLATEE
jgi:RimJ/RimL family protein N-acetyltransferase